MPTPASSLSSGSRVQTVVGLRRHGTVIAVRPHPSPGKPDLLDVRWDDAPDEICTGIWLRNIAPSSAVDALAAVLARPAPPPPARRDTLHFIDDLVVHAGGNINTAGRLGLGFALLNGRDSGAWW